MSAGNATAMRMIRLFAAALLAAPFLTGGIAGAAANGAKTAQPRLNCTCRYNGRDYHLGESACIRTPEGPRLARCALNLNNTSWEFTDKSCPLTQAPPPSLAG